MGPTAMDANARPEIRVVLVDDHEMVAEALSLALAGAGVDVVARASSIAEAVTDLSGRDADLVLLDFRLPDGDGLSALHAIHAVSPGIPVLVLTAVADIRTATDVLTAGAVGYITKDLPITDLLDAVRTAAAGRSVVAPDLLGPVMSRLRSPGLETGATLTNREHETLRLLDSGLGIGDIASQMHVTRNTARKHVQAVLTKLGAHTQLEAVATARRAGLLDPP
jgi:DNA-binding NarL/FixJ family response regulator